MTNQPMQVSDLHTNRAIKNIVDLTRTPDTELDYYSSLGDSWGGFLYTDAPEGECHRDPRPQQP